MIITVNICINLHAYVNGVIIGNACNTISTGLWKWGHCSNHNSDIWLTLASSATTEQSIYLQQPKIQS